MHTRPADVAALPVIIKEVQSKGGNFGVVGDLVGRPDTATIAVNVKTRATIIVVPPENPARKEDELMAA